METSVITNPALAGAPAAEASQPVLSPIGLITAAWEIDKAREARA